MINRLSFPTDKVIVSPKESRSGEKCVYMLKNSNYDISEGQLVVPCIRNFQPPREDEKIYAVYKRKHSTHNYNTEYSVEDGVLKQISITSPSGVNEILRFVGFTPSK